MKRIILGVVVLGVIVAGAQMAQAKQADESLKAGATMMKSPGVNLNSGTVINATSSGIATKIAIQAPAKCTQITFARVGLQTTQISCIYECPDGVIEATATLDDGTQVTVECEVDCSNSTHNSTSATCDCEVETDTCK